jgi:cardiolipin synthase
MNIELLIDFDEFWSRLRQDIANARGSIFVQTFALEGDEVGHELADALQASPARDKRILADSFTRYVLSDRFRYAPANLFDPQLRFEARATEIMILALRQMGVQVQFTNPFAATPRHLLSRNHKKLITIDDQTAFVGGINFSEHNASWHDMMFRISDPETVRFLRRDFLSTWMGGGPPAPATFDGLEVVTSDGRNNRQAFQRVIDLIEGAHRSIFVESPYITFPFYERLRAATRRGVRVTIVTPEQNNWRLFANYARVESARSDINLHLFTGGMSHLKAMLIDDEYLIAGSSNFDYLSYRIHQELIAIITQPQVIADFQQRVVLPDLARSKRAVCEAGRVTKQWLGLQARFVDAALTILT